MVQEKVQKFRGLGGSEGKEEVRRKEVARNATPHFFLLTSLPRAMRPGGKGSLERPRRSVRAASRLTEGNLAAQWAERCASVSGESALSEGRCLRSVSRNVFLSESEAMSQGASHFTLGSTSRVFTCVAVVVEVPRLSGETRLSSPPSRPRVVVA